MEFITSRQNVLAAHVKKLGTDRGYRRENGQFLCEGPKLIAEAVAWGGTLDTLLLAQGITVPEHLPEGVRLVSLPADLLKAISTVETPQGLLAVCKTPPLTPPDKLSGARYLVLDGVQDPGNVGTIWRTADAFGADGLFLLNACADPWGPKTVRATMGACFRLPAYETDLESLQNLLTQANIPLRATALREDTADVRALDWTRAAAVIGSEGKGVSSETIAACAATVKIPMRAHCESLNAATAATVVLWEMARAIKN